MGSGYGEFVSQGSVPLTVVQALPMSRVFEFVRNRLHVGLGGRIGNRQAQPGCPLNAQLSTLNQSGELAAHFARDQR